MYLEKELSKRPAPGILAILRVRVSRCTIVLMRHRLWAHSWCTRDAQRGKEKRASFQWQKWCIFIAKETCEYYLRVVLMRHCLWAHSWCARDTQRGRRTEKGRERSIISMARVSHVTYEGVMSHMNESCHILVIHVTHESVKWVSHVTYEWVMSRTNESYHIWMSHVTYEWVMSHMHESNDWVMSHMNESCHIWMSHVT